jgi:hypothetical protein
MYVHDHGIRVEVADRSHNTPPGVDGLRFVTFLAQQHHER